MTTPEVDDLAAALDALLIDGAFGPLRRLTPDLSVAKVAGRLATRRGLRSGTLADMEAVHTYEGTETIQTLIVGRDITGVGAFA